MPVHDVLDLIGATAARLSYVAADGTVEADGMAALAREASASLPGKIAFVDFVRPHFFFITQGEMLISRSLPALLAERRARGLPNELDREALAAYRDAGLVLPPFTVITDVFQVPALSELARDGAGYSLRYGGLEHPGAAPFASHEDVLSELRQAVERGLAPHPDARVVCTVSGGADSAVLLSVVCEVVDPRRVTGLTCRMPGFEGELARAARVGAQCGVPIEVYPADDIRPAQTVDDYVRTHSNLVLDPVVPVIAAMFRDCIGDRPAGTEVLVIEGQGADTVLAGLPHNLVLALYRGALWPLFRALSLVLPRPNEWLQIRLRPVYRFIKTVRILAEPNWRRALLRSLDLDRRSYPRLYDRLDRMLQAMFEGSGDRHKAILLFFLHILQAREAQKYHLLPAGVEVLLPFMDLAFMRRCYATPTPFFLRGTRRKIPINESVRKRFPDLFSSEGTSPFAVRYRIQGVEGAHPGDRPAARGDRTYEDLKAYSIAALDRLLAVEARRN